MKKTLIALAALAAAGAVSAQSAVTLYGRLDLGLSTTSSKWTNQTGAVAQKTSSTSLAGAANQLTGSRLGVRGTEDLGGGMSAFFDYALNINPDTTGSAVGTTRLAYAGLRGGFGTVTIGTFDNALDSTRGLGNAGSKNFADAFGQEADDSVLGEIGLGVNGSSTISAEFDAAGHVSAKSQNAISYQTPSMGGFSGQLSLSSEARKNEVGATISEAKGSTGVLGLSYAAGPIEARFAYAKQKAETPATDAVTATVTNSSGTVIGTTTTTAAVAASNTSASDWVLSASYDLGVANPRLIYERSEGKTVGSNEKRKVSYYAISSDFDLGAFKPWVTLAYGKFTSNNTVAVAALNQNANASTTSIKQRGYELGVSYTLSQRTSLYSFYNSERAKLDNQHKFTTDNLAVGVVHKF